MLMRVDVAPGTATPVRALQRAASRQRLVRAALMAREAVRFVAVVETLAVCDGHRGVLDRTGQRWHFLRGVFSLRRATV
jgi:hypothetical protein